MAKPTATENHVSEFLKLSGNENTDCKVCNTCNKSITGNG